MLFERGAFIIPFSKDQYKDSIINSIICDYNYSNELNRNDLKLSIYQILEPINIKGYKLNEVKIAQHLGQAVRYSWPCYLLIAEAGGFLSYEFLLDNETELFLNNKDFNVFMWPYKPHPATYFDIMKSLSNYKGTTSIRNFVKNGGGYIGSCYGASVAAAGSLWPLPIIFLRKSYNTKLPSIPFFSFAIADNWMRPFLDKKNLYITTGEITNTSHPISFGINKTVTDFFDGAWFKWLGKNSEVVGYHRIVTYSNGDPNIPNNLKRSLINTPNRVVSKFGEGKIVQFACNPEYVINISIIFNNLDWEGDPYYGQRSIQNALFYASSERKEKFYSSFSYPIELIDYQIENTKGLNIEENEDNYFEKLNNELFLLKNRIKSIRNSTNELKDVFINLFGNNELLEQGKRHLTYTIFYSDIYIDYINKTLQNIDILNDIIPMFNNVNLPNNLEFLIKELMIQINKSQDIITKIQKINKNLQNMLNNKQQTFLKELILLKETRNLINTYEINLKYIPQLNFKSLKTLRDLWYFYESKISLD